MVTEIHVYCKLGCLKDIGGYRRGACSKFFLIIKILFKNYIAIIGNITMQASLCHEDCMFNTYPVNPGTIMTARDVQIHVSWNVSLLIEIKNFFQIMTHQIQVMTSVRVQIYVKIRKGYKNWNTLRCVMISIQGHLGKFKVTKTKSS